jgi:hypothetical protein
MSPQLALKKPEMEIGYATVLQLGCGRTVNARDIDRARKLNNGPN